MRWTCISIQTSREAEDAISNMLIELGSGGVQIEDENIASIILKAYFPPDDMIGQRVSKIQKLLEDMRALKINVGKGRISMGSMDEKEWSEPWKEFFKPLAVGKRILIFPTWEAENIKTILLSQKRDILIQIDPGMAFGTGRHSTTMLCLEFLEKVLKGGENVLDIGTGSGILSIASCKLGAVRAVAVDVDKQAVVIAKENSRMNNTDDSVILICCDGLDSVKGKYEVIVSNISTRIILSIIPRLSSYMTQDGKLILSGILESEASEIRDGLENNNFTILEMTRHEEWVAFLAKNR
jgi:ribosomal protein L11 methyltransferase